MDPVEQEITDLPATLQRKMARLVLGGWTFERVEHLTFTTWMAFSLVGGPAHPSPPGEAWIMDRSRYGRTLAELLHKIIEEDFDG